MGDDPNHGFVTSVGCWTHEVGMDLGLDEDVFTKQDINYIIFEVSISG